MKNKTPKGVLLAIPVVLLVLWFAASWYATRKAEERIEDFLYKNQLSSAVQWDKLKATPFGKVTLSGLTLTIGNQPVLMDSLVINKFDNDEKKPVLDLRVTALQDKAGHAPSFISDVFAPYTGRAALKPIDFSMSSQADYRKDTADFAFTLTVPEVIAVAGELELKKVAALAKVQQGQSQGAMPAFALLGLMSQIEPVSLTLKAEDKGGVERFVELYKRYDLVPDPSEKNVDKHKAALFEELVKESEVECLALSDVIRKTKSSCKALTQFILSKNSTLQMEIGMAKPTSLAEISMAAARGNIDSLTNKVYVEIK